MKNTDDTKLIKKIITIHIVNGLLINFILGTINIVNNEIKAEIREKKDDGYLPGRSSI
jgi:hypothetical protein